MMTISKNLNVSFLGAGGVMGSPMTSNIAKAGFYTKAWNRTIHRPGVEAAKNAGANISASIAEAVKDADVIITCLGDVPDVEAVVLGSGGITEFAKPGTLIIEMSTIGPEAARKIGSELKKRNLRFLDAPISGGDVGAINGTLTIMVGGETADFEEAKPILEVMGNKIFYCGSIGSGQAVKLSNQVLCGVNMVALCEAMQIAKQQNIDPNLIVEVCGTGAGGSWALSNLGAKIAESDFAPGFMIKHMLKDLRLVQEALSENSLPGVDLADKMFKRVQELDDGNGDRQGTQAMIRAYRNQD